MSATTITPDFEAARFAMVESQLRPEGVVDRAVVQAMGSVPREKFVPESVQALAYVDRALPLGGGRFLTAPSALGQLLTQMMPEPGQRALIVGGGTGYSAAVFAAMGLDPVVVENDPELAERARKHGIRSVEGPLEGGDPKGGPYDQILIDGAVEFIPDAIVAQLADGGRLGAALIDRGITRLIVGRKAGAAFGYLSMGDAGVPALPGFSRPKEFIF
jgi:protein-L-isoaspartate(D-aspartate) O-methyltransferase